VQPRAVRVQDPANFVQSNAATLYLAVGWLPT